MGLMLSVLVFCVGVAEILDCWHHFLLHLVQPQYNPLPSQIDLKTDYLSDRDLQHSLSESRKSSHVDICWPKDLSPDDNLHVIKKRPHGDLDPDTTHRVVKKLTHQESGPLSKSSQIVEGVSPDVFVHSPEPSDGNLGPSLSRETSPSGPELGVIVESESSSEVDEPSQIENLNYKAVKEQEDPKQAEEVSRPSPKEKIPVSEVARPRCPSAKVLDQRDSESVKIVSDIENRHEPETSSPPDLPQFTNNILSHNVTKVLSHYPSTAEISNVVPSSNDTTDNEDSKIETNINVKSSESENLEQNSDPSFNINVQPISSLLNEGLEPISEFPEIKIQSSSPVSQADDSDSSLNTSDASWMVRSKTSDRPLVIRFDTSREKIQQDFQSVVDTDLRALADIDPNKGSSPLRCLEKTDSVDVYYDALMNQNGENGQIKCQIDFNSGENPSQVPVEADVKQSSVNFMQIDSNSSSSSLSGIPPLPEDTTDSLTYTSLPADNGFSQSIDGISIEFSNSQSETPATCDNESRESCVPIREESIDKGITSDDRLDNTVPGIEEIRAVTESPKDDSLKNDGKKEIVNVSDTPNNLTKINISEQNKPSNEFANKDRDVTTATKEIAKSSSSNTEVLKEIVNLLDTPNNHTKINISEKIDSSNDLANKDRGVTTVPKESVKSSSKNTEESHSIKKDLDTSQVHKKKDDKISDSIENKSDSITDTGKHSVDITTRKNQNQSLAVENKEDKTNVTVESSKSLTESEDVSRPPTKSNIPTDSQPKTETQKETLTLPKQKSSKKEKTKSSPKNSSTDNSDTVVVCRAKESDEKIREENRAMSASVETKPPNDSSDSKSGPSADAGPSKPTDGARPSTSKTEEDKAFWLIFSGEYTKAMNKDWHSGHFCCWQCDESLTGQRYVLRDEHPYCVKCYESVFANGCEECNKTIGIDSKDLSYKDKHWHEACFLCNKCRVSLVDKQFGSKSEKIFCGNCYDQQFASRCDGCGQIFKAGTKKMEYKTRQWHEPCFACCVCKSAIGTKSFIPREQEIYCATCYEEKFATRCVKCNKIITSGGVTYKNEPWHRECFTCTNCNTSLAGQRFTSRDEKPYCAECFGELFAKRCTACSKPITGIGGTRFISFEDRHWHNDCFICASCKTSLVGRGFITDGDDIICPECAKQKLM